MKKSMKKSVKDTKVIIITGTPCTGKTTLAKRLSSQFGYRYIDVNSLIKKHKLNERYDKRRQSWIVDVNKLAKYVERLISKAKKTKEKGIIIDSHLSHFLPADCVDICIVTKCSLKKLQVRLKKRGYNASKVRENLDAEIFDICLVEARENGYKNIVVLDTAKYYSQQQIIKDLNLIINRNNATHYISTNNKKI